MACADNYKDDWISALNSAISSKADVIPKGFLTKSQIAKKLSLHEKTAESRLRLMVESGLVERKVFRTKVGTRLSNVLHWRIKP